MRRFLASVLPVALMGVPIYVYRGQFEELGVRQSRVMNTFEARGVAFRISRNCGLPADRPQVEAMLNKFAAMTADNPAQVQGSLQMQHALDDNDLREVAAGADRAIAEEERMLGDRRAEYAARMAELRHVADWAFALSVLFVLVREGVDCLLRKMPPPRPRPQPGPGP